MHSKILSKQNEKEGGEEEKKLYDTHYTWSLTFISIYGMKSPKTTSGTDS